MKILIIAPLAVCLATMMACSGSNNTSFFKSSDQSNSNVSVDVPGVKVKSNDNSKKIKIFGKTFEKSNNSEHLYNPSDTTHFINGDKCKYCDYIGRTENEKGHLIESEVAHGFRNGEEREYQDGELIRSTYYVDGAKSGMEYFYSHGKKIDSAYSETTSGSEWNSYKIKQKLPFPVSNYIYNLIFFNSDKAFSITTTNGMISTVYKEKMTDSAGISLAVTIDYEPQSNFSDFTVNIRDPFPEKMKFKDNELIERSVFKGGINVFEFKRDSIVKELFPNGQTALYGTGNVNYSLDSSKVTCSGECHTFHFFENGITQEEEFYLDGKPKKTIRRNKDGIVLFDYNYPTYYKMFYDDGSLQNDFQGTFSDDGELVLKNGVLKSYFPDGKPELDITIENGNNVKMTEWYKNGNVKTESDHSKADHSSYERDYFENGQMAFESQGTIKQVNGEYRLVEGTQKEWQPDGLLRAESFTKDSLLASLKSWDSTGFLIVDFERNKHLKTYTSTRPSQSADWTGNVVYENGEYSCIGNCIEKKYLDNVLVYMETKEEFDPNTKNFKKVSTTKYDSTGKKLSQKIYHSGELANWKEYFSGQEDLSVDFNKDSHLKYYSKSKTLSFEFKGKSKLDAHVTYIDGIETRYYDGKKKKSETKWKDSKVASLKSWDENNIPTVDFVLDKHLILYYPGVKKEKNRFEGKVYYNKEKEYIFINGVLKVFDESGKLTQTQEITNRKASDL